MEDSKGKVQRRQIPEEEKIDLLGLAADYIKCLRRTWAAALTLAVLAGALFYGRDYINWNPSYVASATFTVRVGIDTVSPLNSYYENSAAQQMAVTFPYILTSGALSRKASDLMGEPIRGAVTASAEPDTNLFTLSVRDSDPQRAYETLQAVIQCYPDVAEFIVGKTSLNMLDDTGVPQAPVNPRESWKSGVRGAALGAGLGLIWTALVMLQRKTVRRRQDIPRRINIRCLGELPLVHWKKRSRRWEPVLNILDDRTDEAFQEGIRQLRHKVEASALRSGHRVILVTSALAGEGKSTVAANLALSLARQGRKVVLMDCDLRHPTDRKILGVQETWGLREVLEEKEKVQNVILDRTKLSIKENISFFFLPGGKPIRDASRLLGKKQLGEIIEAVKSLADFVILDSAPAGLLTDAGLVAQYADTVICVIRKDYAPSRDILEGLENLNNGTLPVMGGILNG